MQAFHRHFNCCLSLAVTLLYIAPCASQKKLTASHTEVASATDSIIHYYYDYNRDFPQYDGSHMDDCIIELQYKNGSIANGYFWGTTDEFCDVREGFYPGFFVLRLEEIKTHGDSISFVLDSRKTVFLSGPVDVSIHSADEALLHGYHRWVQCHTLFQDSVEYRGAVLHDRIILDKEKSKYAYMNAHHFLRTDLDKIKKVDRCFPEEIENRE